MSGTRWSMYGKDMYGYVYACPLRYRDKWPTSLSVATASQLENLSYSTTTVIPVEVQVSVREYVFVVFFRFQKNMTFYVFLNDPEKRTKSVAKILSSMMLTLLQKRRKKFVECL